MPMNTPTPQLPLFARYLAGAALVALASGLGQLTYRALEPTNLVMLYLTAVVAAAAFLGRGPAVFVSLAGVAAFDVLFVPPRFNLSVHDTEYLITFAGLLIVGLTISALIARLREQAQEALEREKRAHALYLLSRDLSNAPNLATVVRVIERHAADACKGSCLVFIVRNDTPQPMSDASRVRQAFPDEHLTVINWVLKHNQRAGRHTNNYPQAALSYLPLASGERLLGMLAVDIAITPTDAALRAMAELATLTNQAALAIERILLAEEARTLELLGEKERLQKAVLHSISHDLRTPLVAITGALSHLAQDADALRHPVNRELIETAHEEAARLNQIVTNLLDMTRLETGTLDMTPKTCDLKETLGIALGSLRSSLGSRAVEIHVEDGLPDCPMAQPMLLKVLVNILDNAIKYSPKDSSITVSAALRHDTMHITVADRGRGIPDEDLTRVFEKFYRAAGTSHVSGTGLGLSICQAIVTAYRGRIVAENRPGGGTIVSVSLPVAHSDAPAEPQDMA